MSFLFAFRSSMSLQGTTCCPCTQGTLWALTATSGSREPAPGRALPSAHPVKGTRGEAPGDTLGGTLAEPPTKTTAQSGPRGPQNSPISPGSPRGPPNPEVGAVTRSLHHLHAVSGLPGRLQLSASLQALQGQPGACFTMPPHLHFQKAAGIPQPCPYPPSRGSGCRGEPGSAPKLSSRAPGAAPSPRSLWPGHLSPHTNSSLAKGHAVTQRRWVYLHSIRPANLAFGKRLLNMSFRSRVSPL